MANREKGEVSLTVSGTAYVLALNIDAMIAAEEMASTPTREMPWDDIVRRYSAGSAKYFRIFIWAMFRKHHPDMTLEKTSAFIDAAGGVEGLAKVMQAAATAGSPDPVDATALGLDGKAKGPRRAQATGTGGSATSPVAALA
jgi:hypothetical protein